MKSRVTIITPNLNQVRYLEQTIDSVLSQGFSNLEYIIIDGGSTDGSVDIIKKYGKYLAYWVSEPDTGQSHAINKGVKRASGEIINWLNSDDYLEKGALNFIADQFGNEHINVVCAHANLVNDQKTIKQSGGTNVYAGNLEKTIGWGRIDQPETWFRKAAWDRVGLLNTDLHYLMDREWWIRYLLTFGMGGIVESDRAVVNFRLHKDSKTVSQSDMFQKDHDAIYYQMAKCVNLNEITEVINANCDINTNYQFPSSIITNIHLIQQILQYYLLHRAHEFYYQGNSQSCKVFLKLISPKLIDEESQKLYRKISLRNRVPIKKFLNALRPRETH